MRGALPILLLLAATVCVPEGAGAQPGTDTAAMVEQANRQFDEWIDKTRAFVGDVRVEAADIESFIEHYDGFSTLGEGREDEEEFLDYDEVLADAEYRSWASANGLAAEPWLKKSMRIVTLVMRDQMQANFAMAETQLPEQRRMIEQQCAQVGAEMCQQMKDGLEASVAMFEHQKERVGDLPQPTENEQGLLERYAGEIEGLMTEDDEEWEEDYG